MILLKMRETICFWKFNGLFTRAAAYWVLGTLFSCTLFAQAPASYLPTTNKKAAEALERSTKFYNEKNFEKASQFADEALRHDSTLAEAYFLSLIHI